MDGAFYIYERGFLYKKKKDGEMVDKGSISKVV